MAKDCVLITGSNTGLGRSLALEFASHNNDIVIHGIDSNGFQELKAEIKKNDVNCYSLVGDLRVTDTLNSLLELGKQAGVSLLINNAGLHCPYLGLEQLDDNQIVNMIHTNLIVPMLLTKRFYQLFRENKFGAIININSLSGLRNHKLRSIYGASKWGLNGFSKTFQLEAKENNVRVLDVYPGRIKTKPEFEYGMQPAEVAQKIYQAYQNKELNEVVIERIN